MTVEEMQTERALIVAAINDIVSGKTAQYQIGGRSARRLDLPVLYERLKELDDFIGINDIGSNRAYVSYPSR
jgi:hypothetical protein